jgi:threonine dehydrogenase-like Zn-dependent dehydrogenase
MTAVAPRFAGGGRIETTRRPVPAPGPGELLVAVRANAICGSERFQFEGGSAVTPGHELAGVVAACGEATGTAPGTPGVVYLIDFCGACRWCRAGATNQCLDKRADVGFTRDGGYGPFALISERAFFAVDPSLSFATATLLLDVMGTSRHALERGMILSPQPDAIAIAGAGPVGLGVLAMARLLLGPSIPIAISDVEPYRLQLAEQLGGIPVDAREQSLAAALGPGRASLAVDTSGQPAGRAAALAALGPRGTLVCVGHGGTLTVDASQEIVHPELAIVGSEYFPVAMLEDNHRLLLEHRDRLEPIVTHRLPVGRLEEAMRLFFGGRTGKVVVEQAP